MQRIFKKNFIVGNVVYPKRELYALCVGHQNFLADVLFSICCHSILPKLDALSRELDALATTTTIVCLPGAHSQRIPSDSNGDGPKWVCDPHRIAQQKECLVYSIGSNGNTMFEEGIKREIGEHCEIHTFDLVTRNARNGDFSEKLQKLGATFHPWGLGTSAQAAHYAATRTGPPLYSLSQIMDLLNHTHRMIDIFKIDCEWCEWHTYPDWIQVGNLRQILVETHNAPMPAAKDFFYSLHDAGYVIFSKEANFQNGGGGVEYAFLKLHTDFFINNTMYSKLSN